MRKLIAICCLIGAFNSSAQQIPQYSQYLRNQFTLNPGAAGIYDFVDLTLCGRWQWVGFGDEPRTSYLSATGLIGKQKPKYNPAFRTSLGPVANPEVGTGKLKHAIGGQALIDQYGAFRKIQMAGTYAIHLPISSEVNMSFGTRLGISNNTFIREKAVVLNTSDPYQSYAGGDNTYDNFTANSSSKYMMDLGMGLYLYSNDFFVGFAADHLTRDLVEFGSGTANFNTQMHFNVMGGVKIPLNENLSLTPAFVAKYMWPAPPEIEGSLQLEYKKWLWGGMSYRHKDAVIAMFGMNLSETFKFGYSYDFTTSKMSNVSAGGHELVLGIMFR